MDNGDMMAMLQNQNFMNNPLAWLVFLRVFENNGWGGNNAANAATVGDVADSQWRQEINNQIRGIVGGMADSGYANAQLINGLEGAMNQGFNGVTAAINTGFMGQTMQLNDLGAKMQQCCCEIKTQALENRLADAEAQNTRLYNQVSNNEQTQYILGQLGRYATNPPTPPIGLLTGGTQF